MGHLGCLWALWTVILVCLTEVAAAAATGSVTNALQLMDFNSEYGDSVAVDALMVASFSAQFDHELFFPSQCAPNPACSRPTILPCCDDCPENGTFAAPSDCFCPSNATFGCLDADKRSSYRGSLPPNSTRSFAIGLSPNGCQDVAVGVTPFTLAGIGPDPSAPLAQPIMCDELQPRPLPAQVYILLSSVGIGFIPLSFTISIFESSPAGPNLTLPVNYFYSYLDLINSSMLYCPGSAPVSVAPSWLTYPTTDPALAWCNDAFFILDVFQEPLPTDILAFNLVMWIDPSNSFFAFGDVPLKLDTPIQECVLRVDGLTNSAGVPYAAEVVAFEPPRPNCSLSALLPVVKTLTAIGAVVASTADSAFFRVALPSLLLSNPWRGCSDLLSSLLTPETALVMANYTGCLSLFGTEEYAADPCCNLTVASQAQCCAMRSALTNVTSWTVNLDAVESQCQTPACTQQLLASNTASLTSLSLSVSPSIYSDPRLTASIILQCSVVQQSDEQVLPIPCTADSDCPLSGICAPDPLLVLLSPVAASFPLTQPVCALATTSLAQQMSRCYASASHPLVRLILIGKAGLSSDASDDDLAAALARKYTEASCINPHTQVSTQLLSENCTCTDCYGCNWLPGNRSEAECGAYDWRGDHFCSIGYGCAWGEDCVEVSRFAGCFYEYHGAESVTSARCEAAGGRSVTGRSPPEVNCWFSSALSSSSCLPSALCPPNHLRLVSSMNQTWCDEYCVLPALSSPASCHCKQTPDPSLCDQYGVRWNATLGECLLSRGRGDGTTVASDCTTLRGVYWHGAFWQDDLYADEASCQAHGLCTSDPAHFSDPGRADFAYTESECTQHVGCDVAAGSEGHELCAAAGLCSSLLTLGRCEVPLDTVEFTGARMCHAFTFPGPLLPASGCFTPRSQLDCDSTWNPLPHHLPVVSEAECLSQPACLLPNTTILSLKPPSDCVQCGGVVRPLNVWFPAKWGRGTHVPFVWRPRQWTSTFVPSTSLPAIVHLDPIVFEDPGGVAGSLTVQNAISQQQLQWNVLPLIACDCGADSRPGCFSFPQMQRAAQTVVCVGQPSSFWPPISEDLPSFGLNTTGAAMLLSPQIQPCTSVFFSIAQMQLFERPSSSPFSSLLLSTLHIDSYSILRNAAGVPYAQLRGDVVGIDGPPAAALNDSSFCLCDRSHGDATPPSFSVPDYASFDPVTASFTPLFASVSASPYFCRALCLNSTPAGSFAPILRTLDPAATGWADLLSENEAHVFLAAVVLFAAFGALASYRMFSLLVATRKTIKVTRLALLQLTLLAVFCLLRALLFGLLYAGFIPFEASVGLFAFAEIPTMVEFSLAVFVAYIWASAYHTQGENERHEHRWITWLALSSNAFLVAVFICLLIALAALGPTHVVTACAAPAFPPQAALDRAYRVIVALIALLLGALLAVYSALNLARLRGHGVSGFPFWQFAVVGLATVVGLLVQSALVFYIAFQPGTMAVLVFGAVAELLRPAALLLTARLQGWREDWCFGREPEEEPKVAEYVRMEEDEL